MKKSKESMDPDFDIFEVDYSEEFDRIVAKRRAVRRVSVLIPAVAACLALTLFLWPDKENSFTSGCPDPSRKAVYNCRCSYSQGSRNRLR